MYYLYFDKDGRWRISSSAAQMLAGTAGKIKSASKGSPSPLGLEWLMHDGSSWVESQLTLTEVARTRAQLVGGLCVSTHTTIWALFCVWMRACVCRVCVCVWLVNSVLFFSLFTCVTVGGCAENVYGVCVAACW